MKNLYPNFYIWMKAHRKRTFYRIKGSHNNKLKRTEQKNNNVKNYLFSTICYAARRRWRQHRLNRIAIAQDIMLLYSTKVLLLGRGGRHGQLKYTIYMVYYIHIYKIGVFILANMKWAQKFFTIFNKYLCFWQRKAKLFTQ